MSFRKAASHGLSQDEDVQLVPVVSCKLLDLHKLEQGLMVDDLAEMKKHPSLLAHYAYYFFEGAAYPIGFVSLVLAGPSIGVATGAAVVMSSVLLGLMIVLDEFRKLQTNDSDIELAAKHLDDRFKTTQHKFMALQDAAKKFLVLAKEKIAHFNLPKIEREIKLDLAGWQLPVKNSWFKLLCTEFVRFLRPFLAGASLSSGIFWALFYFLHVGLVPAAIAVLIFCSVAIGLLATMVARIIHPELYGRLAKINQATRKIVILNEQLTDYREAINASKLDDSVAVNDDVIPWAMVYDQSFGFSAAFARPKKHGSVNQLLNNMPRYEGDLVVGSLEDGKEMAMLLADDALFFLIPRPTDAS